LRQTRRTVPIMFSIELVQASERRTPRIYKNRRAPSPANRGGRSWSASNDPVAG
jgi:hypothetical protein